MVSEGELLSELNPTGDENSTFEEEISEDSLVTMQADPNKEAIERLEMWLTNISKSKEKNRVR